MSVNPQDSVKQPAEPSRPISIKDSESEPEEELEQGEGCHSESKPMEEANLEQETKEEDRPTQSKKGKRTLVMNWKMKNNLLKHQP